MYIVYYDESGDDGNPGSSPLFVLSGTYLHYSKWTETFEAIYKFRKQLKKDFRIPVKLEFHTKYFILNKKPYLDLKISNEDRVLVIDLFCKLIGQLELKVVNVVINKRKIIMPDYNILGRALTYSVQRIENDLNKMDPTSKFVAITDPGRLKKMRKTARRLRKINFIPSKFSNRLYRKEIKLLIEDLLQKESKESYFIQISDLVAYIVYLYSLKNLNV